jgi:4-hydroxyphenylacetate 3-monooxygenase
LSTTNLEAGLGLEQGSISAAYSALMTGSEYKESLRDGRKVLGPDGKFIEDVTQSPQLGPAINLLAEYYDAQHAPETQDLTTYIDEETGLRSSLAWKVPRTPEDLEQRRRLSKFTTYQTMGVFGRPVDYGSLNAIGLLSLVDEIQEQNTEWGENVRNFVKWGRSGNYMSADVVADVQSDRTIPVAEKPGRLRRVETRKDGIVVTGAKPCASVAAQGHIGTILTILSPGADPEAVLFAAVPINAPGITLVCREPVARDSASTNHPLDVRGEEADTLMLFDNVFIPNEMLFSIGRMEMLPLYHEIGALPLWHILARLAYKAEIFAGTAQLIADILGTTSVPQVRDTVAEITAYATTLKAYVLASERTASVQNGVIVPNERYVTAGRLHSIENYPRILQLLRDLSGQGLISRFTDAQFAHEEIGARMQEYLPGTGVTAIEKNHVFDFVWDLTCGGNAMRVALFENVNATPAPIMRNRIYNSNYRQPWRNHIADTLGLDIAKL